MKHRLVAVFAAAFLALVVSGSAYAFECYNTQRSEQGNASGANGQGLISPEEFLSEDVGLCPEGVDHVLAGLEEAGYPSDPLINIHALMAGGLEKTGKEDKLNDGKGIDHLPQDFFDTADALIGEGFGVCGGA
jgi:hypothetical protein